jgi:hypothetical protein
MLISWDSGFAQGMAGKESDLNLFTQVWDFMLLI